MIDSFEYGQEISEIIKTPKEVLTEAINDPKINGNALLDVFEKYIENNNAYDEGFDREVVFYRLGLKLISDGEFNPRTAMVESSEDPKLNGFPDIIKKNVEHSDKGEWGCEIFRYIPADTKWTRFMYLMHGYDKKISDIALSNPEIFIKNGASWESEGDKLNRFKSNFQSRLAYMYGYLVSEVIKKEIGEDLLASGEWLGHGTFVTNLENMLKDSGMLKSPYRVLNSGQSSETILGAVKSGEIHKALIFFYHLKGKNPNNVYTLPAGRYGTVVEGVVKAGDLGIYFPTDVIYNNGLTFGSWGGRKSTSEFFATKSSELINNLKEGKLSSEQIDKVSINDGTELPLREAFYRVDDVTSYEKVKQQFLAYGLSDDWVDDHVFLNPNDYSGQKLKEWLETRSYKKANIPKLRPKLIENNFYVWEAEESN